jgi:hypothetical protein
VVVQAIGVVGHDGSFPRGLQLLEPSGQPIVAAQRLHFLVCHHGAGQGTKLCAIRFDHLQSLI